MYLKLSSAELAEAIVRSDALGGEALRSLGGLLRGVAEWSDCFEAHAETAEYVGDLAARLLYAVEEGRYTDTASAKGVQS